ncbi:hypothetical protein GCM10023231_28820 [Olivibacter ginsenosidimutans]|uniref:PIN domain-containing protein n=1 Tax=Olivibacter ginsenosidimutans TaxID=1176537 RepID=A0ABP9BNU3_9SPHI
MSTPLLFDTSVWIDFLNKNDTPQAELLECRKGVTIRKSNDCLIAYYAIFHAITIVHADRDFETIRQHSDLQVWKQKN